MGVKQHNSFQISSIQLKKFDFEQIGMLEQEEAIGINQGIGAIAKKESETQYIIQLNVDLFFKQKEREIFHIKAVIIGIIEVNNNFDKTYLNNMVAIMYSYLRPMVAQMTTMAKLPPLDLQPISFEEFEVKVDEC